jgi:hypothetical protein
MWLGVGGLLSLLGGWFGLAADFRAEQPALGERFRFVSGSMGSRLFPVRYSNCLFVTVNDSGFRLSILFPFRFLTPPLFVPWSAIASIEQKKFLLVFRYTAIRVRDRWPTISVRGDAGQRIADVYRTGRVNSY